MKPTSLLICVVRDQDALKMVDILREKQISFTKLASTGGFLREGNTTLLIGIHEAKKNEVIDLIRSQCEHREEYIESAIPVNEPIGPYVPQQAKVIRGGGVLFEVPIERYERF